MSDLLAEICEKKREHVAACKQAAPVGILEAQLHDQQDTPRGFLRALREAEAQRGTGLIAEIKKASPSRGLIREDFIRKR